MATREKILDAALRLFSERGYGQVSVRNIAGEVGIRESSLYNHFKSKQELFEAVILNGARQAEAQFESLSLPVDETGDLTIYRNMDAEGLTDIVWRIFTYFFEDPNNRMFHRLLTISQYEYPNVRRLYRKFYYEQPIALQSRIFRMLMEAGEFRQEDPESVALAFYAPVFLMLHTCDSVSQARPGLERHVRQFVARYHL